MAGTEETWAGINFALSRGNRGLPKGSSLAKFMAEHRSVRNLMALPPLTIEQILVWADEHKKRTGDWPNQKSDQEAGTDETWAGINHALTLGYRGLPSGSSLAKSLAQHRSVRNIQDLPPLTINQILVWLDAHQKRTGGWPNKESGQVKGTDETWAGISAALRKGGRGLPSGTSLANLLAENRGVRNLRDLEDLTIVKVLAWADAHQKRTGEWPNRESGRVAGTGETWAGINTALNRGSRGLVGGSITQTTLESATLRQHKLARQH